MKQRIESLEEFINESNLVAHAEYELKKAGFFDKNSDYNGVIGKAVVELMKTFSKQGHSGFSAPLVLELFKKVASWDVLSPISSDIGEWTNVTEMGDSDSPLWQNKRNPAYFSNDGGKTWWNVDEKSAKIIKESLSTYEYWGSKEQPYWRSGPNPVVDILVVKNAKEILLIQRSFKSEAEPGKFALPGGFHDTTAKKGEPWKPGKETAKEAALRELVEETSIDINKLKNNLIEVGIYEGPGRDPRDNKEAWSKSTLFAINITDEIGNPRAGDDARDAKWFSIEDVLRMKLAFDHNKLILDGLKKLGI